MILQLRNNNSLGFSPGWHLGNGCFLELGSDLLVGICLVLTLDTVLCSFEFLASQFLPAVRDTINLPNHFILTTDNISSSKETLRQPFGVFSRTLCFDQHAKYNL